MADSRPKGLVTEAATRSQRTLDAGRADAKSSRRIAIIVEANCGIHAGEVRMIEYVE